MRHEIVTAIRFKRASHTKFKSELPVRAHILLGIQVDGGTVRLLKLDIAFGS